MTEGIQISPQSAEVGSISVQNVVRKFIGKTSAPTVNDDITESYIVSDMWLDETNDITYQCLDNADGAAVWNQVISNVVLIDDSMADALHRHSELSASDGDPNPAVSVDADGKVGIGITNPASVLHIKGGTPGEIGTHQAGQIIIQNPAESMWSNVVITAYRSDSNGNPSGQLWYLGSASSGNSDIIFLNRRTSNLRLGTSGITQVTIDHAGNVGIGTTSPTNPLSVKEKVSMTAIGGIAVKLTNKTGVNSVAGKLVQADTTQNDAVKLTGTDEEETIGVFLEGGVSDGSEAWVVVNGIADVAMEDNTTATRGNWVRSSITEIGYADATNASPPSPASFTHFNEIGNCIETVTAGGEGTHILARCVLHFN